MQLASGSVHTDPGVTEADVGACVLSVALMLAPHLPGIQRFSHRGSPAEEVVCWRFGIIAGIVLHTHLIINHHEIFIKQPQKRTEAYLVVRALKRQKRALSSRGLQGRGETEERNPTHKDL